MTREQQYERAYRRELARREERGDLAAWKPLRIGDEVERAPRWFRRAVAEARATQAPVAVAAAPARRPRSRARRESPTRSCAARGAPPDADPHLPGPAEGLPLQLVAVALFGSGLRAPARNDFGDEWGEPE
jgi:hypothetical protein